MMDMSVAEIKKGSQERPWLFILKNHWAVVVEFHLKKPGKEIKERNVEDSETAGFLEISSVYKNVSWGG